MDFAVSNIIKNLLANYPMYSTSRNLMHTSVYTYAKWETSQAIHNCSVWICKPGYFCYFQEYHIVVKKKKAVQNQLLGDDL